MNKANTQESGIMALVRLLRGGQVTLPAEARKALNLTEGDYLDLQVEDGTLRLKPVAVIDRATADRGLNAILSRVRYIGSDPEPREEEVMETVISEIRAARAKNEGGTR